MIAALLGALIVGGTLGLLGSGGSILTVPILVYVLGRDPSVAIPESLAIVGSIALLAALRHAVGGRVRWDAFLTFSVGGALGAFAGAKIAEHVPGGVQLIVFALVMALAAWRMLRPKRTGSDSQEPAPMALLGVVGLGVGVMTGFVGVGGGFLIVPALTVIARLPMHAAVATSLAIIPTSAAAGLAGHAPLDGLDWQIVAIFVAAGFLGSQVGGRVGARLPQATLKRVFGIFLIPMAGYILIRELMKLLS
jgi:hypothetical protein